MKYLLAVSGGADSMVMLDILATAGEHELVVAHVNHGIRDDSDEDERLVRESAERYGLEFISVKLKLGRGVSEDAARTARHEWLWSQMQKTGADKVATAHHQDDVIETIAINIARGTGWRGLCSLRETQHYVRPLLTWGKVQIVAYAIEHNLAWREDSTNEDFRYLRNRLRNGATARLSELQKQTLWELYEQQKQLQTEVESEVVHLRPHVQNRHFLIMIDQLTAMELLRDWLPEPLERRRLLDLWVFAKTAKPSTRWSYNGKYFVEASTKELKLLAH